MKLFDLNKPFTLAEYSSHEGELDKAVARGWANPTRQAPPKAQNSSRDLSGYDVEVKRSPIDQSPLAGNDGKERQ